MAGKYKLLPEVPEEIPRAGGPFRRWLGRSFLRMLGWRMEGEMPNTGKLVLAAAPHTSNWDFVLAMFTVMALGVRLSFLMKKEAFFWPFKGLFMRLGGIPIDRNAPDDIVEQIATWYREKDRMWVVITPEGTRAKVDKWKTGFLRVAERAEVPIHVIAWDYPSKRLVIGPKWQTTGDHVEDAASIRRYLTSLYKGKFPDNQ